MVSNLPDFKVRMSADVKDALEAAARANNRSLNKEIVARLEFTLSIDLLPDVDTGVSTAVSYGSPDWRKAAMPMLPLEKRVEELERRIEIIEMQKK